MAGSDENRAATLEAENQRLTNEYMVAQQQNTHLANLFVATLRLHETLDRESVLQSIREIVINLVGSEHFGVYEFDEERGVLTRITSFGMDGDEEEVLEPGDGPVGRTLRSGEPFVAAASDEERASDGDAPVAACIPMKLEDRVTGAIVLYGMLPHKPSLGPGDHDLFDLLSAHAAMALYCTELHAAGKGSSGVRT